MSTEHIIIAYIFAGVFSTFIWVMVSDARGSCDPSVEALLVRFVLWPYFSVKALLSGFLKGWRELHPQGKPWTLDYGWLGVAFAVMAFVVILVGVGLEIYIR